MTSAEAVLFWCAVFLYVVSSCLYLFGVIFRKPRLLDPATRVAWVALLCHTVAIVVRWKATGHAPVMRDYENALAGSWVIVVLFLALRHYFPRLSVAGTCIAPFVVLMLGYGTLSGPELESLTPPFQSPWLWVHVIFAWVAYGSFTVAFAVAVVYLVKEKRREDGLLRLDDLGYRLVACGFVACTIMIAAGSIWANRLWGSYWNWDPIETWSLVSWLIYGFYLHLRLLFGWRGKRAAVMAIVGLVSVIIAFWGVNFISRSFHIFNLL